MIHAGELDRQITIRRAAAADDGLSANSTVSLSLAAQPGDLQRWAKKTDVSDGERMRASQQGVEVTSRFLIRHDSEVSALGSDDILICEGDIYSVTGAKEVRGRRVGIEITAVARSMPPDQVP